MSDSKLPYYKRYPRDYLSDENVAMMTLEEEGAYNRLLDYCWIEGSLPKDLTRLARLCRITHQEMKEIWPAIAPCFDVDGDRVVHPRLDEERKMALKRRQKMSEGGKRGRRKQLTDKEPGGSPGPPPGHPRALAPPGHSQRQRQKVDTETEEEKTLMGSGDPVFPPPGELQKNGAGNYTYPAAFENAWSTYPDRDGGDSKKAAYRAWRARVLSGFDPDELARAAALYADRMEEEDRTGTKYVKQASTFFGPDEHWREEIREVDRETPQEKRPHWINRPDLYRIRNGQPVWKGDL